MKKRKILIVSCVHPPYVSENNGVANVIKTIYDLFGEKFDFYAFALGNKGRRKIKVEDLEYNGVKVRFLHNVENSQSDFFYRFKKEDYNNKEVEKYFKDFLDDVVPDVIHFHSINGLGANLIETAKKRNIKVIVTLHDFWWICPSIFLIDLYERPILAEKIKNYDSRDYLKQVKKLFPEKKIRLDFAKRRQEYMQKMLEKADIVIANSSFVSKIYSKIYSNIKLTTINNPTDIPETLPPQKKVQKHKIIIGFLGGRSAFKGYDTLISAYKLIENKKTELHIYGSPPNQEGFAKKFLKKITSPSNLKLSLIKHLNKENSIKQPDSILDKGVYTKQEKYNTINTMDIVVIPSKVRESFSLATFEPMLLNKFIIVSDSGNQKDLLRGYLNYLVFKTGDEKDLAKKLEKAIKKVTTGNFCKKEKFAEKLAAKFNQNFSRKIAEIYSNGENGSIIKQLK